jgi:hypothetical protein
MNDLAIALITEAHRWVGVTEISGNNSGEYVQMFQKTVDGIASKEPWCMAFAQFCISQIEKKYKVKSKIFKTEHCLTAWNKSPHEIRSNEPIIGSVAIWQHGITTNGHCGIVVSLCAHGFSTIEGNTSSSDKKIEREGDGVYLKNRSNFGEKTMNLVGFLLPF